MAFLNGCRRLKLWELNKAQPQGDRGKRRETGQSNKCGAGFASPAGVSQGRRGRWAGRRRGSRGWDGRSGRGRANGAGPRRAAPGASAGFSPGRLGLLLGCPRRDRPGRASASSLRVQDAQQLPGLRRAGPACQRCPPPTFTPWNRSADR